MNVTRPLYAIERGRNRKERLPTMRVSRCASRRNPVYAVFDMDSILDESKKSPILR